MSKLLSAGRARIPARILALALALAALGPAAAQAATNPTLSGFLADSETLPGATAVAVAGHYAYLTDYYAGRLTAIDISNPAKPVIAGSSAASNELLNASTVNVVGGRAYVVAKNRNGPLGSESNDDGSGNSLTILDVESNPASPAILGTVHDANTLFGAYGVAVSGSYAFVAAQGCLTGQPCPNHSVGNSFASIDVSNPAAPKVVAALHNNSLPAPWKGSGALSHATAVALAGNYAYVTAAYSNRLTIVDVSNPLAPQIVASLKDATNLNLPVDVAVSGPYAYVVDQLYPGRLTVLDVSNPSSPQVVASLSANALGGAYRIRLRGPFAFISASSSADVAAVDISEPLNPRLAGSLTSSAHLHKTTGLDVDPAGAYVVASSPYLSTQSQPLYPPYALQSGGPTLTGTVSVIRLDPTPISVGIEAASEPANPTAQTQANFSFTVSDAIATVQCRLDEGAWLPCTTPTSQGYSGLAAGPHAFHVQATDAAANTATETYEWTVTPPAEVEPPSISGTASVGQTLNASSGSWTGSPSYAYQWLRCDALGTGCLPIEGAGAPTYTASAADAGSTLGIQVTATTSAGSSTAESAPSAAVAAPPEATSPPAVTGTAEEGQTLTAAPGSWAGYPAPSFEYQWERCDPSGQNCQAIPLATGSTYTVLSADVGATLAFTVTAANGAGSAQAHAPATAVAISAAGPLTPLLDEFARPNNTGPPGPNWTHMVVSSSSSSSNLYITGHQVTGKPGSNADFWNPQPYGPNSEEWVTVAVKPNVDQDPVVLGLRFQSPETSSASGYQAYYVFRSNQPDQYKIMRRTNGTSTTLASATGPTLNPGDELLFRAIGSTLELWRLDAGAWTRVLTSTDTTYQGAGYLILTARDNAVRLANFGGGTLP